MSNGDSIEAGEQTYASGITCLFAEAQNYQFTGNPMYYVGVPTNQGTGGITENVDGIAAHGNINGCGVVGWGGDQQGVGVVGRGGVNFQQGFAQLGGTGVEGNGGAGSKGYSFPNAEDFDQAVINGGWGVTGYGGAGQAATNLPMGAIKGKSAPPGVGVYGEGGDANGTPMPGSGVVGVAPSNEAGAATSPVPTWTGCGVAGIGPAGVYGFSPQGVGVLGHGSTGGQGVHGNVPVSGTSADINAIAVRGTVVGKLPQNKVQKGPYAGWFDGPVTVIGSNNVQALLVNGDFTVVNGSKNVAVPFPDGSHRRLYCVESPECWFEDFGEARLVKGMAKIKLPRDFATAIRTTSYHVFLAPYGSSNGLYVTKRSRLGFVVEEQGKGKSNLKFSFRIVGRRKDVESTRFARVSLPAVPKPAGLPRLPKSTARKEPKPSRTAEPRVGALGGLDADAPKPTT